MARVKRSVIFWFAFKAALSLFLFIFSSHIQERKLDLDERPLVVQLSWTSDNREGQFVLKKDQERLEVTLPSNTLQKQWKLQLNI